MYPFNPNAIDCTISMDNEDGRVQWEAGDNEGEGGEDGSHSTDDSDDYDLQSNQHSSSITFSAEREQLFKVQYEEGYDL